ncbi:MAG: DUF6650 family protein [Caldicoprobacterales bacterium]|jgi:hypothetical protein
MGFRITGIDTPIGGISWEYTDSEKKGVQQLFDYLETKRLLINPIEMEKKDWCILSAIEIKQKINEINIKFDFKNDTKLITKAMIDACNTFLDDLQNVKNSGIIYKSNGDWEDIVFSKAMKKFRKQFKDSIVCLSNNFGITFNKSIPDGF